MSMQTPNFLFFTRCTLAIVFAMSGFCAASAQDDPFASSSSVAKTTVAEEDTAPKLTELTDELSDSTRLVLEALRSDKLDTVQDLTRAVKVTFGLEVFGDMKFYLQQLENAVKTDDDRLIVQSLLGPETMLSIQFHPQVQPEGARFVFDISSGAKRAAYAPERINKLISQLSSSNDSVRGTSFRGLKRLGSPAAAAIVSIFADASRSREFPYLRGALQKFGEQAIAPLIGASRAANLQVQVEALRALTNYRSEDAADALVRAYLSPKFPESVRRSALDGLARNYNFAADPLAAEDALYRRAWELLTGKRKLPSSGANRNIVWNWNTRSRQLEAVELAPETVAQVRAANRAADLYEIRPESARNRKLYLLTQLESSKRLLGPSNQVELRRFQKLLPELDTTELNQVLATALKLELFRAACGSCELIGQLKDPTVLTPANGKRSNLINALLSGERHLQFAAFQAIDTIDPQKPFNGSSYVTAMAAFIAQGGGQNAGLVGHQLASMAQSYAATLIQTGHLGFAADDSREFFAEAIGNPDLQFVVISDTLLYPDSIELAQQLRNDWRTKRLPISMAFSSEDSSVRMDRLFGNKPNVFVHPFSLDPAILQSNVEQLSSAVPSWPVTAADRRRHAFAAMGWLEKIASDRSAYRFYELGRHEKELTRLIYIPGFSKVAAKVLSALGTAGAQREMVNFASQNNLPIDERKPIADAFIQSIQKSGTLLTTKEIRLQYDRYNAAEYSTEPQQKLLGQILDAIEARGAGSK